MRLLMVIFIHSIYTTGVYVIFRNGFRRSTRCIAGRARRCTFRSVNMTHIVVVVCSGYRGSEFIKNSCDRPCRYTLPRSRSISRRSRLDGLPSRNASKWGIALRSSANLSRNSRLASVSR